MQKEITFELTNYCEHNCKFCSSNTTDNYKKALFLSIRKIKKLLLFKKFERINISGGEPLAHPNFYSIYKLCEKHTKDIVVYSNLIKHRAYNLHVIDGVYLEAFVTPTPETDRIHILRRVKQGKEKGRPEIHKSRNHEEDCSCNHKVLRYDGKIVKTPCNKFTEINNYDE